MTAHEPTGPADREGQLFRLLAESVADRAAFDLDHQGRVRGWNPGAERLLGYTAAEIIGCPLTLFFTPEDVAAGGPAQHLDAARRAPRAECECACVRNDGSRFPAEVTLVALGAGAAEGFAALVRDRARAAPPAPSAVIGDVESRRGARLAIIQALAEATTVAEAIDGVLRAVCEHLGWDVGLFWAPDEEAGVLRCHGSWHRPEAPAPAFEAASRPRTFERGAGLPGRVWVTRKPAWILDVTRDANFPRAAPAARDGLHAAFACPLVSGGATHGVIEFYSRRVREPDADLLEMMATVAAQIGQFVARRRAEEALRESERRFARFTQHLPGLAWIKDAQGRYVHANDAAVAAFGTPLERLYGRTDDEVFPPATAAQFRENDRRAMESAGVLTFETLEHPDGTVHHSLVSKFPIPGPDDKPAFVGGIAIDVTDLRRAEAGRQFLAETGTVLSSTLDYEATLSAVARLAVPRLADWCSVYLVDTGGGLRRLAVAHADPEKVKWAEEAAHRYPPDPNDPHGVAEVIRSGRPLLIAQVTDDVLPAAARDADHLALLRQLAPRSVMIVPLVARDRTLGAVTFVAAESGRRYAPDDLALAEELGRRAALAVDNARLYRESADALRRLGVLVEASGRLTSSLELPAVQSAILGLSHRLIAADAYAMWRLDATAGEWTVADSANLSEAYLRDSAHLPAAPDTIPDKPIVAEDVQASAALESRREAYRAEGIESMLALPLRVHGAVAGTLVFYYKTRHKFDDVTVRVATALADLAGAALGTAELYQRESALRRRAEESDRAKDDFLAALGHELRNPLTVVVTGLHALRELGAKGLDRVPGMERQADVLKRLVEDLLEMARVTQGRIELRREPVLVADVVSRAVETARPLIDEQGHAVAVDVPPEDIWLDADPVRLVQCVSNLLHNAAKYTAPGGRIAVAVAREGAEVVLRVRDNGIGIRPADLERIFELFAQVQDAREHSRGGLGVGLSLVRRLVGMMGGSVAAHSAGPGMGSEFVIRLPVGAPPVCAPAPVAATTPGGALRVVIADDNEDAAETLSILVEMWGHAVRVANDGPGAVASALEFHPDVCLFDIGMPGFDGYEAARRVRADAALSGVVLVAMTGYGQDSDRARGAAAGFDHYLVKPVVPADIERLLRGLVPSKN